MLYLIGLLMNSLLAIIHILHRKSVQKHMINCTTVEESLHSFYLFWVYFSWEDHLVSLLDDIYVGSFT